MKNFILLSLSLSFSFLTFSSFAQKSPAGDIWLHMLTTGQPAATKFLGDQLNGGSNWYINFEVGQASWNQTDAGIGKSNTDPSAWTWQTANWYENGSGSNKRVRSDFGSFRFTSTGNWYFAGRAKGDAGDAFHYANSDSWDHSATFAPIYYFTVSSLNNPSAASATVNGSNPSGSVNLTWSLDAQNHYVMIVRKKVTESWTEPAQGTAYTVGTSIGSGVVVYFSNGTSYTNTGLTSSTGYDYKLYTENFSYYSSGITTSTVYTASASSDYYRTKSTGNWNSASTWQSSYNNTDWADATLYPSGSANTTVVKSPHTITISSAETVNSLTIESGSTLTVSASGNLTASGVFVNNGSASSLVIENGGSLITNGSVSGSATVERFIDSDNNWHFISAPVSGQNICDGNFAPTTSNFNSTTGVTYDFYTWSEPTVSGDKNWINLKNADWSLNTGSYGATPQFGVGNGYLVAYSSSFAGSTTKTFAGTLSSGDKTITLGNAGTSWNLIGNPFASAINWDGITKTSLDGGYYYVYNAAKSGGAGYESYLDASHKTSGANGKISASQGFFVKASGTSIVLANSARVHDNNWMDNTQSELQDQLVLSLHSTSNFDESFLVFESCGSTSRDYYDAFKMLSMDATIPQLSTLADDNTELSINSLPFSMEAFSVPVRMHIPSEGNYSLTVSGIQSFSVPPMIVLEDKSLAITHDLITSPEYTFSSSPQDDPDRFILHFEGLTSLNETSTPAGFIVEVTSGIVNIFCPDGSNTGLARLFDMTGRLITEADISGGKSRQIDLQNTSGVYLLTIESGNTRFSRKLVIN